MKKIMALLLLTSFWGASEILAKCCSPVGVVGPRGPQGPQGPVGPTGATGATGAVGGLFGYAYVYNNAGAQAVANNAAITFNATGPFTPGITHVNGTAPIIVADAGTYAIFFSVSADQVSEIGIAINGAVDASARYTSNDTDQQNTGFAILALAAGDSITIVNQSGAGITLTDTAGMVNASVLIERVA